MQAVETPLYRLHSTVHIINYMAHITKKSDSLRIFKYQWIKLFIYDGYSAGKIYQYLSFFHKEITDLWPIICIKIHASKNELGSRIRHLVDQ